MKILLMVLIFLSLLLLLGLFLQSIRLLQDSQKKHNQPADPKKDQQRLK
jgi:hypothetical protein